MATPINISVRQFSKIFWAQIMEGTENTLAEKEALAIKLNSLESLRDHAEYNTGSISFSAAWCIYNLTKYLKVKKIIEIGTFIGKVQYQWHQQLITILVMEKYILATLVTR